MVSSTADTSARVVQGGSPGDALSREAMHARIELLRSQLNPDFLFNTLNSLSSLILAGRMGDADRLVGSLARYLRAPSGAKEPAVIAVEKEVGLAAAFLDIEALRMDRPASVIVDVAPELADKEIPCLVLLPLVEAAVRAGRRTAPSAYRIALSARSVQGDVLVELEQTFQQPAESSLSHFLGAIEPLCARLVIMYGSSDRLTVDRLDNRILARLRLPAE